MKSDTIILSIHPCHIEKIFSGCKLYEYRKYIPSDIRYIVVYATSPIKKIVALIEVEMVITDTPDLIWKQTGNYSGITKEFFLSYFKGRDKANAIKFKSVHKFDIPQSLSSIGIQYVPQSYMYVDMSILSVSVK